MESPTLYTDRIKPKNPSPEWHKTALYEGLIPRIERSFLKKENGEKVRYDKEIERFVVRGVCPHCHGTRLTHQALSCKMEGKNIAECADMQITELLDFVKTIHAPIVAPIVSELEDRIQHMVSIGLGYLSLSRETSTLSGGESQRIKMVDQLGSNPETVSIDQKGIRASKRSNIVTYTGIFDAIRGLFAKSNDVNASLFSFNSQGACPVCKGLGVTYTDLAFMDTVTTMCEECHGHRYKDEVLAYTLRGKSIADVLSMTISEALDFFREKEITTVLRRLSDVGVTYITLGQPLSTLSGGELQRIKLAAELENSGQIYVLDEPSAGLHMADVEQLVRVMNRLVEQNSTLIVIEHNLDIICEADWIIDLGPYAGQNGGRIMFSGPPKDVTDCPKSLTGK